MNGSPLVFSLLLPLLSSQESAGDEVCIRGRLLAPDGRPVAAVPLHLVGEARGEAEDWTGPETHTDANGAFELCFEAPPSQRFLLSAVPEELAEVRWRWPSLAPGVRVDVGNAVLRRTGSLTGRVVDAEGEEITSHWRLDAISPRPTSEVRGWAEADQPDGWERAPLPESHFRRFEATGVDGSFRFDDLPDGPCRLVLHLDAAGRVVDREVTVVGKRNQGIELTYDGPDLAARIHLDLVVRPLHHAYPALENVVLRAASGDWHRPRPSEKRHGLDFDDLPPGLYTLEIDDPRFEPVQLAELAPGSGRVEVEVRGTSAVRLIAEDGASGEPVQLLDVRLRFDAGTFPLIEDPWVPDTAGASYGRDPWVRLARSDSEPLARGLVRGLVAGDYTLRIASPDHAAAFLPLAELLPGETRLLEVELTAGGSLGGRVVDEAGDPVSGAEMRLFAPGDEERPALGRLTAEGARERFLGRGWERAAARTDAEGRFTMPRIASGDYRLRARRGASTGLLEVTISAGVETVLELRVDDSAR